MAACEEERKGMTCTMCPACWLTKRARSHAVRVCSEAVRSCFELVPQTSWRLEHTECEPVDILVRDQRRRYADLGLYGLEPFVDYERLQRFAVPKARRQNQARARRAISRNARERLPDHIARRSSLLRPFAL